MFVVAQSCTNGHTTALVVVGLTACFAEKGPWADSAIAISSRFPPCTLIDPTTIAERPTTSNIQISRFTAAVYPKLWLQPLQEPIASALADYGLAGLSTGICAARRSTSLLETPRRLAMVLSRTTSGWLSAVWRSTPSRSTHLTWCSFCREPLTRSLRNVGSSGGVSTPHQVGLEADWSRSPCAESGTHR
jgi:hypothetical protein